MDILLCINLLLKVMSINVFQQMSSSSEQEIDLHMGHRLTFWSGHSASCQSHSDLRMSNMFYANQI